jgi:hypothetical protein
VEKSNIIARKASGAAGGPLVDGPRAGRRCGCWMDGLEFECAKLAPHALTCGVYGCLYHPRPDGFNDYFWPPL